jgi:hypothetical protein
MIYVQYDMGRLHILVNNQTLLLAPQILLQMVELQYSF